MRAQACATDQQGTHDGAGNEQRQTPGLHPGLQGRGGCIACRKHRHGHAAEGHQQAGPERLRLCGDDANLPQAVVCKPVTAFGFVQQLIEAVASRRLRLGHPQRGDEAAHAHQRFVDMACGVSEVLHAQVVFAALGDDE